jgi:hypothetical protein
MRVRPGWAHALLSVLAAAILAGCSGSPSLQYLTGAPAGVPGIDAGTTVIGHAVGDLDLEAMVPPGGEWVTDGPVHGSGPDSVTMSRAAAPGRHGVLHAVFLCLDTAGHPVTATFTWFNESGPMPCDPGLDTVNSSVAQCGSGSVCPGRDVFTFAVDNSAKTVMPRIEVPRGASWELFAWLAPSPVQPGAGVSEGGAGLKRFTGYGLSFTYPRSWDSLTPARAAGDDVTTLAFQSTVPLRDACPVTTDSQGNISGGYPCGLAPVAVLPPDGVLVDWSMTDQVTDDAPAELGRRQTVAGHQAWLASGPAASVDLLVGTPAGVTAGLADSPTCRKLGASQVVEATINASAFMSYQMLACIRGRTPTRPSGT